MDFELCFKVHNLVYVQPKRIKLGQTINLNVIFHLSITVKFETRPSSLRNFGTAYSGKNIYLSSHIINSFVCLCVC